MCLQLLTGHDHKSLNIFKKVTCQLHKIKLFCNHVLLFTPFVPNLGRANTGSLHQIM